MSTNLIEETVSVDIKTDYIDLEIIFCLQFELEPVTNHVLHYDTRYWKAYEYTESTGLTKAYEGKDQHDMPGFILEQFEKTAQKMIKEGF